MNKMKTVRKYALKDSAQDRDDLEFWKKQSYEEKISVVETLRQIWMKMNLKQSNNADFKRLLSQRLMRCGAEEFFELLNRNKVRYLIVGGYAVAIHSRPRFTNDIDIWIDVGELNAGRVLKVLEDFGFAGMGISLDDLLKPDQVIQLGYAPLRIDLLTSVLNVTFADAWERKVEAGYGGETVYYIGKEDLITSKKGTGRKRDQKDLDELD